MRLLHTTNFTLRTYDSNPPKYVILSHTWLPEGECTFQDVHQRQNLESPGWSKIRSFCELARRKGYDYARIDTCCIDKTSSAELQEAINSLFLYHRESFECIVYLADVMDQNQYAEGDYRSAFVASRWPTRAWTLQELLAPKYLEFRPATWLENVGTRKSLALWVEEATGIAMETLRLDFSPKSRYAAEIFGWASRRKCTRDEDRAYSLLGLLGINMPLLYGEGSRALERLQQEILTTTDDESALVWSSSIRKNRLFADSIDRFPLFQRRLDATRPSTARCPNLGCDKAFPTASDLRAHRRKCDLGVLDRPRPMKLGNQGLYVKRLLIKYSHPDQRRGLSLYFVILSVPKTVAGFNRFLLRVGPVRYENVLTNWLLKDDLNFVLCHKMKLFSIQDLDTRYLVETEAEYELLILKDHPHVREPIGY